MSTATDTTVTQQAIPNMPDGPVAVYDAWLWRLRQSAANAARRNKPVMWAYYLEMEAELRRHFAGVERTDGSYAGVALATSQLAEREAPILASLDPSHAARWWAVGVYCRRILRAWGVSDGHRPSLAWLHDQAARLEVAP